jgi:putative tryptophan/tyrosine transport system substrate-binding protein
MKRREFIAGAAALLVSPRRSLAQGARRRVGVLGMGVAVPTLRNALLDGLRNHGSIDGRNLIIEYRYAPSLDRLPAFAAELVALSGGKADIGRTPHFGSDCDIDWLLNHPLGRPCP